ncbi:hypothetical protein PG279_06050 [Riemerella anatipestifer]|nr:hypothetical protein [Riemerella anatipestifer]
MTNELKIFSKPNIKNREDFKKALKIAEVLINHLNEKEIINKISLIHKPYTKSSEIQDIFLPKARELGFVSEKKGIFSETAVTQLRPDYFLRLSESQGIIMEVERGKTLANNMDLLDLWKCHICPVANFLFLIVPNIRQNSRGNTYIFNAVVRRMETFFTAETYTNVDAVFIFSY